MLKRLSLVLVLTIALAWLGYRLIPTPESRENSLGSAPNISEKNIPEETSAIKEKSPSPRALNAEEAQMQWEYMQLLPKELQGRGSFQIFDSRQNRRSFVLQVDGVAIEGSMISYEQDKSGKWRMYKASIPTLSPELPRFPEVSATEMLAKAKSLLPQNCKLSDLRENEKTWYAETFDRVFPVQVFYVIYRCPETESREKRERWYLEIPSGRLIQKAPTSRHSEISP